MKTLFAAVMTLPLLLGAADLYLAGDSTMCDYDPGKHAPMQGWGTALKSLVKPDVNVINLARGGRSSKSFLAEKGRWDKILADGKPGDYVIIQFGHNDAHKGEKNRYRFTSPNDTYRYYLKIYIAEARAKGMIPVLCTQTVLCRFLPDGTVRESGAYVVACREVAKETGCDFVDLNAYAREKLAAMGQEKAIRLYMTLAEGEFPNYPQGRKDTCHLRNEGAEFYAKGFVELAKKQKLPIAEIFQ